MLGKQSSAIGLKQYKIKQHKTKMSKHHKTKTNKHHKTKTNKQH